MPWKDNKFEPYPSRLHELFVAEMKEKSAGYSFADGPALLMKFVDQMNALEERTQNGQLFGITMGDIKAISATVAAIVNTSPSSRIPPTIIADGLYDAFYEAKKKYKNELVPATAESAAMAR